VVIERAANAVFRYAVDAVSKCAANEHSADAACSIVLVSVFALAQSFVVRRVLPPVLARSAPPVWLPFAVSVELPSLEWDARRKVVAERAAVAEHLPADARQARVAAQSSRDADDCRAAAFGRVERAPIDLPSRA
jgi:hypothetical protein